MGLKIKNDINETDSNCIFDNIGIESGGSSSEGAVKLGETTMIDGNFEFSGSVEGVMPAYILTEEQQPITN